MERLFYILIFLGFIAGVIWLFDKFYPKTKQRSSKEPHFPYVKKKYFLTIAERKFFEVLQQVVGDNHHIFCQVHLSSLLYVKKGEKEFRKYLNKINRKSVDFVILDKQDLSPFLAIELDDSSHYRESRMKRDEFINKVFEVAGIPLLRVKARSHYDPEELRAKMNQKAGETKNQMNNK